jgi:membrane associated rhomboid family serine protease
MESPKWTFIFIGLAVFVYFLQNIISQDIWMNFAFRPSTAFSNPWTFITSIFLHARDPSHLLFNMMALFFLGLNLERMIGRQYFIILFFLSGIVGNIGYYVTAINPIIPAIGASGAVYGVMGALATLRPKMMIFIWGMIPLPIIVVTILWALGDFAGLFVPSGIANGAHLGGLFVGIGLGLYLRPRLWRRIRFV